MKPDVVKDRRWLRVVAGMHSQARRRECASGTRS